MIVINDHVLKIRLIDIDVKKYFAKLTIICKNNLIAMPDPALAVIRSEWFILTQGGAADRFDTYGVAWLRQGRGDMIVDTLVFFLYHLQLYG